MVAFLCANQERSNVRQNHRHLYKKIYSQQSKQVTSIRGFQAGVNEAE